MPTGQRIMVMKLLGTALLSLAFFSSCSGDVVAVETSGSLTTTKTPPASSKVVSSAASTVNTTVKTEAFPANTTNQAMSSKAPTVSTGWTERSTHSPTTTPEPNSNADQNYMTTTRPDTPNSTTDAQQKGTKATTTNITGQLSEGDQSPTGNTANTKQTMKEVPSYTSIILPVVIALIVISLVVFLLMALYKICLKTTPERQENGTEQAPSDKENVKLISVKTTSPETGEQASLGKNKTRQHNDSSSHLSNKCV